MRCFFKTLRSHCRRVLVVSAHVFVIFFIVILYTAAYGVLSFSSLFLVFCTLSIIDYRSSIVNFLVFFILLLLINYNTIICFIILYYFVLKLLILKLFYLLIHNKNWSWKIEFYNTFFWHVLVRFNEFMIDFYYCYKSKLNFEILYLSYYY